MDGGPSLAGARRRSLLESDLKLVMTRAMSEPGLGPAAQAFCADQRVVQRYLHAALENGQTAADAVPFLVRTARWREEHSVDTMFHEPGLLAFEAGFRTQLLYNLSYDARGRPLMIERVGAWDLPALAAAIRSSREEVLRSHILVCEIMRRAVDAAPQESCVGCAPTDPRAVLIFDAAGLPWTILGMRSIVGLFKETARIDAEHFPDTVGTIFVVNVSRAFRALWAAVSRLVAAQTCYKVRVFSWTQATQAAAELRELCGDASLPVELGGLQKRAPPYWFAGVPRPADHLPCSGATGRHGPTRVTEVDVRPYVLGDVRTTIDQPSVQLSSPPS